MPDSPVDPLATCRAAIDDVDRQLMVLVAERVRLGRQAAELKRTAGRPIHDPAQEATVLSRASTRARELSLPADEVRALFEQVIAISRRAQEAHP